MSWISAAIGIGTALFGAHQSKKQGDAAIEAGKDPLKYERRILASRAMSLIKNPESFYSNPLYRAAFGQGLQANVRAGAASQYIGSGNMATGLQSYGQGFAFDMFMEYERMLAEMAGFSNFQPRSQGLDAYSDARKGMMDSFGQIGAILGPIFKPPSGSAGTPSSGGGGGGGLPGYPGPMGRGGG